MTEKNKDIFIIGGVIALVLILKKGFSSIFPTQAPTINTGLSKVFTDNLTNHQLYTYSRHADQAQDSAEVIHDALGIFNDDYPTVIAELQNCSTQGDVFQIAQIFKTLYNEDFWSYLSTGTGLTPLDGLTGQHLTDINNYVNSLPL